LLLSPAASCCLVVQKADAEAAKLYEDFVESFAEDPAEKGPKAFVRGEVIQPGQRPSDSGANPQHNKTCLSHTLRLQACSQVNLHGVLASMFQSSCRLPWLQHWRRLNPNQTS